MAVDLLEPVEALEPWEVDLHRFLRSEGFTWDMQELRLVAPHFGIDLESLTEVLRVARRFRDLGRTEDLPGMGQAVLNWELQRLTHTKECWPHPRRRWSTLRSRRRWDALESSAIGVELRQLRANRDPDEASTIASFRTNRATRIADECRQRNQREQAVYWSEKADLWAAVIPLCAN